jgi:hypothetical protein
MLSSNLEIYLESKIDSDSITIIGKPSCRHFEKPSRETLNDQPLTMINYISPEIITRNKLLVNGRVTDINFIKFEFVC